MSPRAKDLFLRAHELDGEEREAFLAEACGEDAELRLEIQHLLVDSERADSMLDALGVETTVGAGETDQAAITEREGDVIGPYILRQQIGEGGFGVVWMAEQSGALSRMVALKVVKAGMDTRQVLARFEAERQALAMMDHPNIAKVLDAGATPAGRPYFVMELVKGIPITEFCDQQKFGPRQRLGLFRDVCSAINHAHQKGIIHRDLKPSNVMVTLAADVPVVKVIDFGIAKATHSKLTDKTLFTRFEQFLGTPVYMSPEQAAMSAIDVDTRSDIYSLGVLLYELLAGTPPFDAKSLLSAGYDEMRRIIAEDEPPKPSTKLTDTQSCSPPTNHTHQNITPNSLRGELDWIVMKAIEKDRSRRYETANAFAADIGRYLSDEPVLAAAPSATYKFRKFARRNKTAFGVAAAMVFLLVAGTAVSVWQALRATDAEQTAKSERADAVAAQKKEEKAKEEAVRAKEEAEDVAEFMTGVFKSPDPAVDGRKVTVVETLERAEKDLEHRFPGQPDRRAKLQLAISNTYESLGLYPEALKLRQSIQDDCLTTLGTEHPVSLSVMINLARSYAEAGRYGDALTLGEEVLRQWLKLNGPEYPETITAMLNLAFLHYRAGHLDKALKMHEEVLVLSEKVKGAMHPDTLKAMSHVANSYHHAGRRKDALDMFEKVLDGTRFVYGPKHPAILAAMDNLALSYHDAGRTDDALKILEPLLELKREVLGTEHPQTPITMHDLAKTYLKVDRGEEALALSEEALDLDRAQFGAEHSYLLRGMDELAECLHGVGRTEEALEMRQRVLDLQIKVNGLEDSDALSVMNNLAVDYFRAGRRDKGLELLKKVLRLRPKVTGPEHRLTLRAMINLAAAYYEDSRLVEAMELSEQAAVLSVEVLGPEDFETQIAMKLLLDSAQKTFYANGRQGERAERAIKALEAFPDNPAAVRQLGFYYYDRHPRQAEKAIATWSKTVRDNPQAYYVQSLLGELLVAEERYEEARALLQTARKRLRAGEKGARICREQLLKVLIELGPEKEAAAVRRELEEVSIAPDQAIKEAALQVWFGKDEDYDAFRRQILEKAKDTADARLADVVAKLSGLRPSEDATIAAKALALAGRAVELNGTSQWYQMGLGLAEYRSAQFAKAAATLEPLQTTQNQFIAQTAGYYRAMSLFRQRKTDKARKLFTATEANMASLPTDEANPLSKGQNHDPLILWLAYREAGTLLELPFRKGVRAVMEVLVQPNSEWRWLHPLDGVDPAESDPDFHRSFFTSEFDDASWQTGKDGEGATGGFGYGDDWFEGVDLGTPEEKALGKSAYFRHRFTTTREYRNLELRCQRDDGIIVYLDGKEVARDNMSEGEEAYGRSAASTVSDGAETTVYRIPFWDFNLPAGEHHVLAISLHNRAKDSSDLRIGGIMLVEVDAEPKGEK